MPDKKVKWYSKLPPCSVCGAEEATHDSYLTTYKTWGYTCEPCFEIHGCSGGFILEVAG